MLRIALLLAMLLSLPVFSVNAANATPLAPAPANQTIKQQLLGSPVYIQIFKQERTLELYVKYEDQFRLLSSYRICKFSGGLGNKRHEGDFKSPEGFYSINMHNLKPDSRFYRAINVGFPNEYDRDQGYSGRYLMIHGNCLSIGCYAMTDASMDQIFTYVDAALRNGQPTVQISIFPFHMTPENMKRQEHSSYIDFWRQLQPGYAYFQKNHQPPTMNVVSGRYVLAQPAQNGQPSSQFALTSMK
jgi:murein L,D-transpeptidase YafK